MLHGEITLCSQIHKKTYKFVVNIVTTETLKRYNANTLASDVFADPFKK